MASPNSSTPGPFDGPQWPHLAPRGLYVAVAVLMGLVVASASLLNGLVIVVSIRHRRLRSPLNHILVNLAVANLLVTLSGSSVSLASNIRGFFAFGERLCQLEGFMPLCVPPGIVGLWSLAILALERYLVVCRPLAGFQFQHRHAASGCAFTWGWSLLWTTPPLLGWSSYVPEANNPLLQAALWKFPTTGHSAAVPVGASITQLTASPSLAQPQPIPLAPGHPKSPMADPQPLGMEVWQVWGLRTSCGPNWYTGGSNNSSYILALFVTCFVMPLSLILFSYTNLLLTLRAAAAQQREAGTTQQAEREVTRMVVAMVVAFLACWLPYTTFALVVATHKDIVIQPALASLPSYFSKTATFQSCLLGMLCCGHHPRAMGKTSPAAPSPQVAAEGLRNKVTPSHPV
ncbi:hypothetical protein Nmel_016735 [Mimus melanotis]